MEHLRYFHEPSILLFFASLSYVGIFFLSVISGWLLPFPEEAIFLSIGYIAAAGVINPFLGAAVAGVGVLIGDTVLFSVTRWEKRLVPKLKDTIENSWFGKSRLRFLISQRSVGHTVFLFRFVVGLRFLGPIWAGIHRISLRSFLMYDAAAMIIYTSFIVAIGYFFHDSVLSLLVKIRVVKHAAFLFVLVLVAVGLVFVYRSFLAKRGGGITSVMDLIKDSRKGGKE